jgi:hypothetical protein
MSLYTESDNEHMLASYAQEIRERVESISDDTYRNIASNAEHRLEITHLMSQSPYGLEGPLAHPGGLLVHTALLMRMVYCVANSCSEVNDRIDFSFLELAAWLRNIGWHTTTVVIDGQVKRRDAHLTTGLRHSGFRFMHDVLLHVENDIELTVPEAKKQALTNIYAESGEICTLEGRILEQANSLVDTIIWGEHCAGLKRTGNWSPDHNGLFVGHYD